MQCPSCGTVNEAGRKFCHECGSKLAAACPSCGSTNPPGARFCGECGTKLEAGTPAAGAGTAVGPGHAVGGAPGAGAAAGPVAERRLVSVLFADLVGFTSLAEGRDAETVRELLSAYFDLARDVITRHGGTVEKFIGDAVMAVWGAPVAREDDAERAVRAALEVVDAVRTLGPEVHARAGVVTGEAAVTLGARDQGMVAGDLVNTASRLQSVAAPGTVLVGETTQRAASGSIAFEPAGDQVLKGKEAPVPAWRALRVVAERFGRGRSDRLEAPFVGRDAELRLLKDLFHATSKERRARLVSITGQAGIGKSRLAWEFEKYVDGVVEKVLWHDGRSPAYGEGITFWALGEMVRARTGLAETDDPETTRRKVAESVAQYVPDETERRWIEPALLALLGAADAPPGGRDELFRAWRTFFERIAANSTVALVFEDLQWADPGLLDFIDHLLEWSRGVPILILTLARPDLLVRRPDWGAGRRNFLALGLEPLDADAMRELLAGLVPGLPATTARSIIERADGIPLYAVEMVRMLVSDGRLREVDGRYEPVGELGALAVPETLQALIAARLDGLDPTDRSLLQDAAVLGQSFTLPSLAAVNGGTEETISARLHDLAGMELLEQLVDPRSPERGQYIFVQSLIREVAYGTLAKRDRRTRHLAAARFFESLGEDELAGALAAHYVAAYEAVPEGPEGDALAVQARLALTGAADRAVALGSPEQAMTFLTQAAAVTTDAVERAAILERLGRAATAAARPDVAATHLQEAIAIRRAAGDEVGAYRATLWLAEGYMSGRLVDKLTPILEEAVAYGPGVADEADLAAIIALLSRTRSLEQRLHEALALADRSLEIAERLDLYETMASSLITKGSILANHGRPVEGLSLIGTARELANDHGLFTIESRALTNLTIIMASRDVRATWDLEMQALEFARRIGRRDSELTVIGNAGEDAVRLGDWDWIGTELASYEDVDLPVTHRLGASFSAAVVSILRNAPGVEAEFARLQDLIAGFSDNDFSSSADDLRGWSALAGGDFAAARDAWLRQGDGSDTNAPFAYPRAGMAALLAHDAAGALDALERLTLNGTRGRVIDVERTTIDAGIAAIGGRTAEAVAGYRAALSAWGEMGLPWDQAWATWTAAETLGPSVPEVRAWGAAARSILEQLGATPVIGLLDRALGTEGATLPRPAAAAGGGPGSSEVAETA